jgi:hypothetical protein
VEVWRENPAREGVADSAGGSAGDAIGGAIGSGSDSDSGRGVVAEIESGVGGESGGGLEAAALGSAYAIGSACASEPVEPAASDSVRGLALGGADSRRSAVEDGSFALVGAENGLGLDSVGWPDEDEGVSFVGEVCPSSWRDCSERKVHRPM